MTIEIVPLALARDIVESDDLASLIADVAPPLRDGDIIVVTPQAVSKSEGRLVDPGDVVICEAPTYPGSVPVF